MYLTRMELDTEKRATRKLLCSRSKIHGMVESAFSGGREKALALRYARRWFVPSDTQ